MTPCLLNDSRIRRSILSVAFCLLFLPSTSFGIGQERYVETVAHVGSFPIADRGVAASIYVDGGDYAGVVRAARDLVSDVRRPTRAVRAQPGDAARTFAIEFVDIVEATIE